MKIAEIMPFSMKDFPNIPSAIVFAPGCNYNCGFCHNPEFVKKNNENIPEEKFFRFLDLRKEWLEGVVISGGEPTLQFSLPHFIKEIKKRNLAIKLDTNGSNYVMLNELNKEGLVDYVAMDVKGPRYLYPKIIGTDFIDPRDGYEKSIAIVSTFPDYEFRTTIAPLYENDKIRWMTPEEIGDTAKLIYNCTGIREHKYFLQKFKAIEKEEGNKLFLKKNLAKEMWETPMEHLERCLIEAKKYLPNSDFR